MIGNTYIHCVQEKFCNVVESGVYSVVLKGLKYLRVFNQI